MAGRVSIVNGDTFYSPNSRYELGVDDTMHSPCVFVRGVSRADQFQRPRWWTAELEWLSCIPTMPIAYSGVLMEELAYIPHNLQHTNAGYHLPGRVVSQWLGIEKALDEVVSVLQGQNGQTFTRPFTPSAFGYHLQHQTESQVRNRAQAAREWFSIWLGLLYWQIHQIHDPDHIEGITPAKWVVQVAVARKFNQALLDSLRTAPLLQRYWDINRAGVILHSPPRPAQPSPAYFININVPVWYRWGPAMGSSFPAPTPHELQLATTWIAKAPRPPPTDHRPLFAFSDISPERPPTPPEFLGGSYPMDWEPEANYNDTFTSTDMTFEPSTTTNDHDMCTEDNRDTLDSHVYLSKQGTIRINHARSGRSVWEPWLKEREEIVAKRIAKETPAQRQKREGKERNPPTTSAMVYVWDWDFDDPSTFKRTLVRKDEREETLISYSAAQKRYDSVFNEWNCCEEWGDDLTEPEDYDSGDEGKETEQRGPDTVETHEEVGTRESGYVANMVESHKEAGDQSSSTQLVPVSQHEADSEQFLADHLRCAVLEILCSQFGFTVPKDLGTDNASTDPVNGRGLLHTLGIAWAPMESPFFSTALGQRCLEFLACFSEKIPSEPRIQQWDMAAANQSSLAGDTSLRCIRVVANSTEQLYMFDFGVDSTVPWKIAVYTATAALTVCRMDRGMREKDIAIELVLSGTRFRTLQLATTVKYIDAEAPSWTFSVPIRLLDHEFTKTDYEYYRKNCQEILKQRRGRAALLHGGFVHRIAIDFIGKQDALSGPIGKYRDSSEPIYSVVDEAGNEYLDDELSQDELDALCGLYISYTGRGSDKKKVSWFPLAHFYNGSGEDVGRWSGRMNDFYDWRVGSVMGTIECEKVKLPWTPKAWRQELRGAPQGRRAMKVIEERSREFINHFGPPAAHR